MAKKTEERLYPIVYTINQYSKGKDLAWIKENDLGACDDIFIANIITPPEGGFSVKFDSMSGKTGKPLTDTEIFELWCLLTKRLSESKTLAKGTTGFLSNIWAEIKKAVFKTDKKARS